MDEILQYQQKQELRHAMVAQEAEDARKARQLNDNMKEQVSKAIQTAMAAMPAQRGQFFYANNTGTPMLKYSEDGNTALVPSGNGGPGAALE